MKVTSIKKGDIFSDGLLLWTVLSTRKPSVVEIPLIAKQVGTKGLNADTIADLHNLTHAVVAENTTEGKKTMYFGKEVDLTIH